MLEEMLKCVERSKCFTEDLTQSKDDSAKIDRVRDRLELCLKENRFPEECESKKQSFVKCKRGQMDMRTRIRGNKGY